MVDNNQSDSSIVHGCKMDFNLSFLIVFFFVLNEVYMFSLTREAKASFSKERHKYIKNAYLSHPVRDPGGT